METRRAHRSLRSLERETAHEKRIRHDDRRHEPRADRRVAKVRRRTLRVVERVLQEVGARLDAARSAAFERAYDGGLRDVDGAEEYAERRLLPEDRLILVVEADQLDVRLERTEDTGRRVPFRDFDILERHRRRPLSDGLVGDDLVQRLPTQLGVTLRAVRRAGRDARALRQFVGACVDVLLGRTRRHLTPVEVEELGGVVVALQRINEKGRNAVAVLARLRDLGQLRLRSAEDVAERRSVGARLLDRDRVRGLAAHRLLGSFRGLTERSLALGDRHEAEDAAVAVRPCDLIEGAALAPRVVDALEADALGLGDALELLRIYTRPLL